jgi:hypothetical protein
MVESFALAGVCGVAVFFMLAFLYALLRDATKARFQVTELQFMERREAISRTPRATEHNYGCLDRAV